MMRLKNSAERKGQLTSVSNKFPVNLVTQIENVCYLARDGDSFVGVSPIFAHSTMGDLYHSYSAPYPLLLPRIFIYLDGDQPLPLQSILGALFRLLADTGQCSIASCQGRWCFRIWDQRLTERRKIWNLHFNPRIPNGTLSAARSSARSWRVCNDDWSGRILKYRKTWNASLRL